jgi:hypothetical protein
MRAVVLFAYFGTMLGLALFIVFAACSCRFYIYYGQSKVDGYAFTFGTGYFAVTDYSAVPARRQSAAEGDTHIPPLYRPVTINASPLKWAWVPVVQRVDGRLFNVAIPLWWLMLMAAVCLVWLSRYYTRLLWWSLKSRLSVCMNCNYSTLGLRDTKCPECGHASLQSLAQRK